MATRREIEQAVGTRRHELAELGFRGQYPTFHRVSDDGVHLLEVSFSSDSSKVAIDIGGQPRGAFDEHHSIDALTVSDVEFSERVVGWQRLDSHDPDDFVEELLNVAKLRRVDLEACTTPRFERLRAGEVPVCFHGDAARLAWLAAKSHAARGLLDEANAYARVGLELVGSGPAGASVRVALKRMLGEPNPHKK